MIRGRGGGVAGIPGKGARQVSALPDSPQPAVEGTGQAGGARLGQGPACGILRTWAFL